MKSFIVASVNKNSILQVNKLTSEMVHYTPIICDSEDEISSIFAENFPDRILILSMSANTVKNSLADINKIVLENNLILD